MVIIGMDNIIKQKLLEIETQYEVKILLAVESGSRAWGFASTDSDWDVRFIYVHRPAWYSGVFPGRDVIEVMDGENNLDFSGWDLRKALALLYKGNPPLFEWLSSPIVYQMVPEAISELKTIAAEYYDIKSAIYHYIHMVSRNWETYVKGRSEVVTKKYLYIFRPLLACKHIEDTKTIAPMEIDRIVKYLDPTIAEMFQELLTRKRANVELGRMPADHGFNEWIVNNLTYYKEYVNTLTQVKKDTKLLDDYLFKWMWEAWA